MARVGQFSSGAQLQRMPSLVTRDAVNKAGHDTAQQVLRAHFHTALMTLQTRLPKTDTVIAARALEASRRHAGTITSSSDSPYNVAWAEDEVKRCLDVA